MSDNEASRQSDNITPARCGQVLAITLDTASHVYDLNSLALGDGTAAPTAKGTLGADSAAGSFVYVTLIADVDFYYATDKVNSNTIDNTAKLGAAGTVAGFTANAPMLVPAKTPEMVRIDRTRDRFLYLQGSAAGVCRVRASSQPSARAGVL